MIEELRISSDLLKSALERYLDACSMISNSLESGNDVSAISQVVASELQSILSYETTIKHAKAKICRIRNSCRAIVPINNLPSEILTRIFQLVVHSQHCCNHAGKDCATQLSLKRPETLSHVCSRWFQIATGFHVLWKHIGLVPFYSHNRLLARGDMFAARAGSLALEIHVVDRKTSKSFQDPDNDLNLFCTSVAPRLSGLELNVHKAVMRTQLSILQSCFANCAPGMLKQVTLKGGFPKNTFRFCFIEAESPSHSRSQVVDLPKQHFEDVLLHVEVLHLIGIYFWWDSQAYHGLVKLTLQFQSWKSSASITESQLIGILAASPMLREFTFGLAITDITEDNRPPPVALNELEYTRLFLTEGSQYEALLRMISPGSKPLQMRMRFNGEIPPPQPEGVFDKFIARANLTELGIKTHEKGAPFPNLPRLIRVSSSLRHLVLHGYCSDSHSCAPEIGGDEHLPVGLSLNSLNLINCTVDLDQLRQMTKIRPIQTLRLGEGCQFNLQGSSLKLDECQSELSEIFPIVESVVGKGFWDNLGLDD